MLIESGMEERNGKDAAQGRRLEKLRRDFGPVFLAALNDPQTIEILLNADGTLWQEKLGGRMEPIGQMEEAFELLEKQEALCLELGGSTRSYLAYCYRNWGLLAREQRDLKKSSLPPSIYSPT
jgi:hypothetical protein